MTCPSCRYEWCWICRERYTPDHYAGWNVNGCAGWQFRDLSPEQMNKRMRELHDSSPWTIIMTALQAEIHELLHGACLPCAMVTCGIRWLLGPTLGMSGDLHVPVSQRRLRASAITYRDALATFVVMFVLQVPLVAIAMVAALLFLPGMIMLRDCFEPKSNNPIKVTLALLVLMVPSLLSYPVGLLALIFAGPAALLLSYLKIKAKWARRCLFTGTVIFTPLGYVLAAAAFAVAAVGAFLVGPGMTIFDMV
mmetsp:Transcript_115728/g.360455  ORF Transcript_115728/g.360455 Transcript_115728/m.360455 type:complete len:251 (-) Transcript_115728:91-843(-)